METSQLPSPSSILQSVIKALDVDPAKFSREIGFALAERTRAAYRNFIAAGSVPSPTALKNILAPAPVAPAPAPALRPDPFALWKDFTSFLDEKGVKESTLKNYRKVYNHIKDFADNKPLYADEWTGEVFKAWKAYMMAKRDYHPNTISSNIKHLKTFFAWCRDEKKVKLSDDHAVMVRTTVDPDIVFLTEADLQKLKEVKLTEAMGRVRDSFVFACLTGMRHGDLKRLTGEQVMDRDGMRVISFIPQKANSRFAKRVKRVEVPLLPGAEEIIDRYRGEYVNALPVLTNQKMNVFIKEIAKAAGLTDKVEVATYKGGVVRSVLVSKWKKVTCHTARHTFATISLQKGVPLEVVSNLLGHSELKTTQIYTHIVDSWKNKIMLDAYKNSHQKNTPSD